MINDPLTKKLAEVAQGIMNASKEAKEAHTVPKDNKVFLPGPVSVHSKKQVIEKGLSYEVIEYANGDIEWYLNKKGYNKILSRENGPAIERFNGDKEWVLNGRRHREDGPAVEFVNGDKLWYLNGKRVTEADVKKLGKMKKEDVQEAKGSTTEVIEKGKKYKVVVDADGDKYWYLNGKLHREAGPAVEYTNGDYKRAGDKFWYLNGKLHREDGPAVEFASGKKAWYLNDKLHREDGPAIEFANGDKAWYLNGKQVTEDDVMKLGKMKKEDVQEALDPKKPASVWIDDFIKSTDVRFKGKSKEERIQMALGAWYAARKSAGLPVNKNESVDEAKEASKGGYTAVEKDKVTIKGEKDGDPETTHTIYDIMLDGEKVGELDVDETLGFIGGNLHGKDLPELSDYALSRGLEALDNFLSSDAGIEWASDINTSKSEEEPEVEPTNEYTGDPLDGSMATVNNVSLMADNDDDKDDEEYKDMKAIRKYASAYEKDVKIVNSESFKVSSDLVKEARTILQMSNAGPFKKTFKLTFEGPDGKQRIEAVAADSINHAIERLYRFNAITKKDKLIDFTSEKLIR